MIRRGSKQIISLVMSMFVCLLFVQVVAAEGDFDYIDPETNVRFHADAGIVPEDAMIVIRQIVPGLRDEDNKEFVDALENLDKAVRKQVEKLDAYIVDLLDSNSNPIQPDGYITVMIPVRDDFDRGDLEVLRVVQGDDVMFESELTTIDGQSYCVFKTNHFSTYCLIDKIGDSDKVSVYLPYVVYAIAIGSLACIVVAVRKPSNPE